MVCAEWIQDRIEPTNMQTVPEAVGPNRTKMLALLTDYYLEFYELVTPDKLKERNLA